MKHGKYNGIISWYLHNEAELYEQSPEPAVISEEAQCRRLIAKQRRAETAELRLNVQALSLQATQSWNRVQRLSKAMDKDKMSDRPKEVKGMAEDSKAGLQSPDLIM